MIRFIYKIYNPNAKRDKHGRVIQDISRRKHSKLVSQRIARTKPKKFKVQPKGHTAFKGDSK